MVLASPYLETFSSGSGTPFLCTYNAKNLNKMSTNQTATAVANKHQDLRCVSFDLESAIDLLKETKCDEAIIDLSLLLEDYKQGDEMLIANASTSILKCCSRVLLARKYLLSAYKSLNGKEEEI